MSADIVLIDLSSILHPIWHMETSNPNPNATSEKAIERVRALASGQPHVAVCIDSRKSFRKDIDPTYKAQRESNEPLNHQMRLTIETLRGDGYPIWGAEGFEADDILASAVKAASDVDTVTLVTADKDILQLVDAHGRVLVKSLKGGSLIGREEVKAKTGVYPEAMLDWLCLVGDSSDNVRGCPGIGPKWASSLLTEFGSLENLWAAFDKGATPTLTPSKRTALQDFRRDVWPTTRQLIALRTDIPLDFSAIFKPRVPPGDDVAVFGDVDEVAEAIDGSLMALGVAPLFGDDMQNRPTRAEVAEVRQATGSMFGQDIAEAFTPADARAEIDAVMPDSKPFDPMYPTATRSAVIQTGATNATREANASDREKPSDESVVRHDPLQTEDRSGRDDGRRNELLRRDGEVRRDGADGSHPEVRAVAHVAPPAGQRPAETATSLTPVVVEYDKQLEPRTLKEAYDLAKSMFASRFFSDCGSPDAVLAKILSGREFGIQALASLRAFHVLDNRITLAADTMRALVLRSGATEYFTCTERTATRATFVTKRRGDPEPITLTYTLEEGRIAFQGDEKAWNKSGWGRNSADMCVARASSKLARLVYSDVIMGIYSDAEFD